MEIIRAWQYNAGKAVIKGIGTVSLPTVAETAMVEDIPFLATHNSFRHSRPCDPLLGAVVSSFSMGAS